MPNYFTRDLSGKEAWRRGTSKYTTFSPRPTPRKRATATPVALASPERTKLPDWGTLSGARGPAVLSGYRLRASKSRFSTLRIALYLFAVATAFSLYINHVHSTQGVLAELQTAERDNLRLHLKLNRLKGEFDRATGPAVIFERARQIGLEEGIAYGPTIRTE